MLSTAQKAHNYFWLVASMFLCLILPCLAWEVIYHLFTATPLVFVDGWGVISGTLPLLGALVWTISSAATVSEDLMVYFNQAKPSDFPHQCIFYGVDDAEWPG